MLRLGLDPPAILDLVLLLLGVAVGLVLNNT